ncbi:energy transducer TonB [bacterium]|jgi:TonB family protein|nr:energy transducer TonB [bacterium]
MGSADTVRLRNPLVFSALFHFLGLLLLFLIATHYFTSHQKTAPILVEVDPISENSRRVVQTLKTQKSDKVAPDAYLGEQNQIVDRQTVGKKLEVSRSGAAAKQLMKKRGGLAKLGIPILPSAETPTSDAGSPNRLGEEWNSDIRSPQEYFKGMKQSDATALNTREYVFYSYFQRIRERLDRAWSNSLREELTKFYRKGRHLASDTDLTTRTLVTLDNDGVIVKVQVLEESGVTDLDDAAINAFNKAGPFPNPPKGLVDAKGRVQIRWDFILKT